MSEHLPVIGQWPLTRYVKLRVAHAPGMPGMFPRHWLQKKPLVRDPGMHHVTCVTHMPGCMSGSLTRGGGENVPNIPGAWATRKIIYLTNICPLAGKAEIGAVFHDAYLWHKGKISLWFWIFFVNQTPLFKMAGEIPRNLEAITMTSWWARWRLKLPAARVFTQSFIQAQIKENIKDPRHWHLWWEFTGDRWIPRTKGQWCGKYFHLMTSSCTSCAAVTVLI